MYFPLLIARSSAKISGNIAFATLLRPGPY
jgi:hypothetical protein